MQTESIVGFIIAIAVAFAIVNFVSIKRYDKNKVNKYHKTQEQVETLRDEAAQNKVHKITRTKNVKK